MEMKVVICDIDNTLIVKHQRLTPRAKRVIETLRAHGIYFGIASGRSMVEVKRMVETWGFTELDILIGLNGSVLWDGIEHQQYEYFIMKKAWIKEIIEAMSAYETSNILMYKGNQLLCAKMDEMAHLSAAASKMEAVQVEDVAQFYQEDNAKIMFRVREADMERIESYFHNHPSEHYRAFKTQTTLLEFSDSRVSKAYTLRKFCEHHHISMEEVLAFGDTSNDNDMLIASGWGVCMCNGSADTKQIADEITRKPCDEDGWAEYMETRFIALQGW